MLWLGAGEDSILRGPSGASEETQALIREQWLPCSTHPIPHLKGLEAQRLCLGVIRGAPVKFTRALPPGKGLALSSLVNFPARGSLG